MPRKVVYGKKPNKASAFAVSNVFFSSSPAKTSRPITAISAKSQPGTIEEAAIALGKLKIEKNHENGEDERDSIASNGTEKKESPTAKTRKALSARDANSKGPAKTREVIQRQLKSTRDDTKIQKIQEMLVPRDVPDAVVPLSAPISQSQSDLRTIETIRPDPTCDPYIAPLISLTNEQTLPTSFEHWSTNLSSHFRISKIAEASYGEVYRLSLLAPHPIYTSVDESVLKIMALKPDPSNDKATKKKSKAQEKREGTMSEISSVESEVKLLKRMTEVPGFTNYRALHILKGRPSQLFIDAWKEWNDGRKREDKSQFPDPSKKPSYSDDTLWAVIEMQDAGTDAEKMQEEEKLTTVFELWDVFWQVVIAIGKGEEEARFEHRDLHCGNICVRNRKRTPRSIDDEDASKRKLGFTNLETTIIDYTFSRAEMSSSKRLTSSLSSSSNSRRSSRDSEDEDLEIAYLDLAAKSQEQIFQSNAEAEYQYEIYRCMRSALYFSAPLRPFEENETEAGESGRTWKGFHPQTNLLWLHFVLFKLFEGLEMAEEKDEKASRLESVLRRVADMLTLDTIPRQGLMSARDLVAIALSEGWLDDDDVRCIT